MYFTPESSADYQGSSEIDEDTVAKIEWLKHNKEPREQVATYMKDTAKHRQKWIKAHRDNISTIVDEYPHIMQAEMVKSFLFDKALIFFVKNHSYEQKEQLWIYT